MMRPFLFLVLGVLALAGCRFTTWAPDGRTLACSSRDGVFLFDLESEKFTRVAPGRYACLPSFSPDGRLLAYYAVARRQGAVTDVSLWLRERATGTESRVAAGIVPLGRNGAAGGAASFREHVVELWQLGAPAWHPDSTRLAFPRLLKPAVGVLEIVSAKGRSLRKLKPVGRFALAPSWSPDGRHLAYFDCPSDVGGRDEADLGLVEVRTGRARLIRRYPDNRTPSPATGPQWVAAGAQVMVYLHDEDAGPDDPRTLAEAVVVASGKSRVTGTIPGLHGVLSPDLRGMVYLKEFDTGAREDPEHYSLMHRAAGGGEARLLGRVRSSPLGELGEGKLDVPPLPDVPSFSPDGRRLALVAVEEQELHVYDLDSGWKRAYRLP